MIAYPEELVFLNQYFKESECQNYDNCLFMQNNYYQFSDYFLDRDLATFNTDLFIWKKINNLFTRSAFFRLLIILPTNFYMMKLMFKLVVPSIKELYCDILKIIRRPNLEDVEDDNIEFNNEELEEEVIVDQIDEQQNEIFFEREEVNFFLSRQQIMRFINRGGMNE